MDHHIAKQGDHQAQSNGGRSPLVKAMELGDGQEQHHKDTGLREGSKSRKTCPEGAGAGLGSQVWEDFALACGDGGPGLLGEAVKAPGMEAWAGWLVPWGWGGVLS